MQRLRILLDLDGTILQNAGRELFAKQFGLELAENESALYATVERLGLDPRQFWDWWSANHTEIYSRAVPITGAIEVVRSLRSEGAFVAVVTARRTESEAVTRSWIAEAGLEVDEMVFGADDKVSVALQLELNLAFEDNLQNAVGLSTHMPVLLINARSNGGVDLASGIIRVEDWNQVPAILDDLRRRPA